VSDLHNLTKALGIDRVAEILGISDRSLIDMRSGRTPITVDDLYELEKSFPNFDLEGTVRRIGAVRESKGVNRRSRERRKPTEEQNEFNE